jgi:hypothetical protein
MSRNDFDPPKSLTFDYVLNYQPSDFLSYDMNPSYDASCDNIKKMSENQKPCNSDDDDSKISKDCYIQTLCENRDLANETMKMASSNQEAKNRQRDSSAIYDNAVQNCVTLCVGIAAMVIVGIKAL